jgi:hypothetical protein
MADRLAWESIQQKGRYQVGTATLPYPDSKGKYSNFRGLRQNAGEPRPEVDGQRLEMRETKGIILVSFCSAAYCNKAIYRARETGQCREPPPIIAGISQIIDSRCVEQTFF